MIASLFKKVFGSRNERLLKQYRRVVVRVNELESAVAALSDEQLRAKTAEFKQQVANGKALDEVLPEAFAVVREAGKRTLNMRHFDVQLIGGIALHQGKIAEMRTGEGKTLVATLPSYLNALMGKGVHIVTVNDYLAQRDADWMGRIHRFLGLSVGCNLSQMAHAQKQEAFAADITYGTNNEFGFDYLRDNMVGTTSERVMRGLNYAIVDEVDSILIDEARTPLIISGQAEDSTQLYRAINVLIPKLARQEKEDSPGDYYCDLKQHTVMLSEAGHERAEEILTQAGLLTPGSSLYDPTNIMLMHHLYAGLRAHALYHRDQHYVVQNNEVIIVDEFTGRMMPGRRWSEGLHQAVEAKEGVRIQNESHTLASITFQNYFRLYKKLAGMTGTADTEAYEFQHIYGLETVLIPTHKPMIRKDAHDKVYRTLNEKYDAILADVKECQQRGQPVLLGTTSIENSEVLSQLLQKEKLPHNVLNAKQHAREAEIVTQAGKPRAITIATNMAGRGTDIVLGGNPDPEIRAVEADTSIDDAEKQKRIAGIREQWQKRHDEVVGAGGLHIIASERHESRRIDNQLRGRSGRQGDPGSSRFYLSLEDPLLKIFAGDRVAMIMDKLKMPEGEAIEHPWVSRSIENAQRKVEARNFDIRKQLLEYDDVANDQRKVIYQQRNELLESEDITETITAVRDDTIRETVHASIPRESVEEQWDIEAAEKTLAGEYRLELPIKQWIEKDASLDAEKIADKVVDEARVTYARTFEGVKPEALHHFERAVMLQSIDSHWREHLATLDYLRQGIHLRGYAQKQPKQEYKREAFELFGNLLDTVKRDVTRTLMNVRIEEQPPEQAEQSLEAAATEAEQAAQRTRNVQYVHGELDGDVAVAEAETQQAAATQPFVRQGEKIGRNDPCWCGSGKKYKHCHGKLS